MYVLIKIKSDNIIESVTKIDREHYGTIFENEAIEKADDVIRKELAEAQYFEDVDFEPNMSPEDQPKWVGAWATGEERWELWEI